MDIHAPEHPIHTWREFGLHIAVVTVGILIAIGLEGVRESLVTHHLLRETRESFHDETSVELDYMSRELPRVVAGDRTLQALVGQMPELGRSHPEQVTAALKNVSNPNYFFSTNAWQAALSTGSLAHMRPEEVSAYASCARASTIYSDWQQKTLEAETRANAFWQSHPHPTPSDIAQGDELIRLFATAEQTLGYLGPQIRGSFERASRASASP